MSKTITISDETWEKIKEQVQEENIKEKKNIYITIRNRWAGDIVWESEKTTYKEAVEEAIKSKVNLSRADLSGADLSGAALSRADLSGANLSEANLSNADLSNADLSNADLSEANLSVANLSRANLREANLSRANLREANLSNADLSWANLKACLFYMGDGNRNFEALCKAIKTIKHPDGKFEDLVK